MSRLLTLIVLAALTLACSGPLGIVPLVDRSSGTDLSFEAGASEAAGQLLAFDPTQHSLDISIAMPSDQPDEIDVFIVTSNGIRFLVLNSFRDCHVEGSNRRCDRELPVMPAEGIDNWRVEALRSATTAAASLEVSVTWVPVGQ
ncbi:MAG TPA: hypothetical protein VHL52_14040 [Acidimicrobiia bacterium]|nr:hypothetical protein [Acidimicrobiia bacterium]